MSHALARMAHRFRGLCQGWRRAGMLAALPQERRRSKYLFYAIMILCPLSLDSLRWDKVGVGAGGRVAAPSRALALRAPPRRAPQPQPQRS